MIEDKDKQINKTSNAEETNEHADTASKIAKIDVILRQILEPNAYDRMSNIKIAKGEQFYLAVAQQLIMYYQKFRIKLSDATVKKILLAISSQTHKDYKIKFVRR